ncbi:zf-HC2 domain-containing protein [Paenibacillus puerhi]|uniref:zf-HC2 domain-containing protein n=1 Tax=Paenibacillus puerhi TaxID=2692622 RepID=UPI001358DE09|nr:zf-HC2 domain-containing protein [Paenibacillus puerhi]
MTGKHLSDQELLHYLNKRCPELDARRIRTHLSRCPNCRGSLSALLDIELELEELPLLKAPGELTERVLGDLRLGNEPDEQSDAGAMSASSTRATRLAPSSPAAAQGWRRELTNGMVAAAATFLFIASGIIGKIRSLNTSELESGVRFGAAQLYQAVETVSRHLLS